MTRVGKFEFAQQGTIMLDEVGELPTPLQAKLLHVVQDRSLTKLGSNRPVEVDVRIVAATNRDLESMMRAGTFREDLYYRLQVIEVHVPPLRERLDEIPALVEFFVVKYSSLYRRPATRPAGCCSTRWPAIHGRAIPASSRTWSSASLSCRTALVLLELAHLGNPPHALQASSQPPAAAPPRPRARCRQQRRAMPPLPLPPGRPPRLQPPR